MKYVIEKDSDGKVKDVYSVVDETPSVYMTTGRWFKDKGKQVDLESGTSFDMVFEKSDNPLIEESIK